MCGAISVSLTLGALSLAGCGGNGDTSSGCGQPFREPLNPSSLQHVIDPSSVKFDTDPPTSGPHLFTPPARGVVSRQLLPAEQVTVLETGDVLVQYRDVTDAAAVQALGQTSVTIAPNATLKQRVVATAWTYKLECGGVDAPALQKFIAAHKGQAANGGK
ncbi:MAG: DUF3105 domain-containing protein [Acidimicrobiales bacterium]